MAPPRLCGDLGGTKYRERMERTAQGKPDPPGEGANGRGKSRKCRSWRWGDFRKHLSSLLGHLS